MKENSRWWTTEMFCPNCGAEYREGFTHCFDCQVELVERLRDEQATGDGKTTDNVRLVRILETGNLADITSIKLLLDSEGIEYTLLGERMNFAHAADPVVLLVREDEADRVKELLRAIKLNYSSQNFIPKK